MATEDAEAFVRSVDANSMVIVYDRETEAETVVEASVEAVVARPTDWCKCATQQLSRSQRRKQIARRESGWMRGHQFGWWLCANCRKPSHPAVVHWVTTMLAGANDLLPKIRGSGVPTPPSQRWQDEGGIINPYANAMPAMPYASPPPKARRRAVNPRRT